MFKKLKDKIGEEFKQAPLKLPVSVQQLAQVISPSPSVNSLSENNASSSSLSYPTDISNVSTNLFSIGDDDDLQDGVAKMQLTMQNVELTASSPSNMTHNTSRSRRSSLSSVTSEPPLFPIYESGLNQSFFQSDMESEMEDGMSGQIDRISKEQLYQSFKKILNRYNKYKGRYTELVKHYKELQHENFKTKNVLQESQDKALRRMAELREQCQLEQKAKAHLEESLRNDVEERDHIIETLKTKISLLRNGDNTQSLINLDDGQESNSDGDELRHLKAQNEDLQREVERLKKIKETACHLIHRCDTTINEATEGVTSDHLKVKMSELKSEIQKMKSENESLSHLLSRNIMTEEDKKTSSTATTPTTAAAPSTDNGLLTDLSSLESSQSDNQRADDKDKKIEKLNNLLLKCKEKINGLNSEIKAKNMVIESHSKTIKELRDEVAAVKAREEETTLSVAENKKAIHEELNAKEEQIKALTKELKTKENEFIKDREDTVRRYEDKIRDLTVDFSNEMKNKIEENEKLAEDLKAKEIETGSLDKLKSMEDGLAGLLEYVRTKSSDFQALANSKTAEIEKAHQRLEERVAVARRNVSALLEKKAAAAAAASTAVSDGGEAMLMDMGGKSGKREPENLHVVEKLTSDVANLSKKIEILESELGQERSRSAAQQDEAEKWRRQCDDLKVECENLKEECRAKSNENTELGKALTTRDEEIRKVETEKEMLRTASADKIETESKLKEYVDKYNRLEKENRNLQNDLMEKCDRLLKDLNESKDRVRVLEDEAKAKAKEMETVRRKHSAEEKKKAKEMEELRRDRDSLRADSSEAQKKLEDEVGRLRAESEGLRAAAAAEGTALKEEAQGRAAEVERLRTELEEARRCIEEMERGRKERGQETERLKNELEALRGNMKSEVKEKEDKVIRVDKLTQECNLLMGEIENLKKTHSAAEKRLEGEVQAARKETAETRRTAERLESELAAKGDELRDLTDRYGNLERENEEMKRRETEGTAEVTSELDRVRGLLEESERVRTETEEKLRRTTAEMAEAAGEVQVRQTELDALGKTLRSLREEMTSRERDFAEEKKKLAAESENRLNVLKSEIEFIKARHEEDIGQYEESVNTEKKEANEKTAIAEKTSAELLDKLEKITTERNELKMADEEKGLKIAELENCMAALKMELDDRFNDEAKNKEEVTAKHSQEVKEIIMQYDKEVADRDEEIEVLKRQLTDHEETLRELSSAQEDLKKLRRDLTEREAELTKAREAAGGDNVSQVRTEDELTRQRLEFETRMADAAERFRLEKEHALMVERETWERKLREASEEKGAQQQQQQKKAAPATGELEEVELEPDVKATSVTPVEAVSGSVEVLQKQLVQQAEEMKELKKQYKREMFELKKKKLRKLSPDNQDWYYTTGTLENDTEHEYLRNILYEYMMGKEQLVLAKVLSAIVKFNEEQTHNVLEKEQQRQTLFGQLGLL